MLCLDILHMSRKSMSTGIMWLEFEDIRAVWMASVWFTFWSLVSSTWKLQRYLVMEYTTHQHTIRVGIEEKCFGIGIKLAAHCVCWSRWSCKSNRRTLLQLSVESTFKQSKQNTYIVSIVLLCVSVKWHQCRKVNSGDFHTIVRRGIRSVLHTSRWSSSQPSWLR